MLFSSSTGRFGRTGQVDYAIANEVLNKTAQQQARLLPRCRVVSVNWGPWDGGMVTPASEEAVREEGVGLIGLEAGAEYLVRELGIGGPGRRGRRPGRWRSRDGRRPSGAPRLAGDSRSESPTMASPQRGLATAFERVLDVAEHPVLESHVLDGRPVLPLALMLEWLAHGALHQNPGLTFHGCNDLRVLHGVVLDGPPPTLRVVAGKAVKHDGFYRTPVELRGVRGDGREMVHARAEVVLAADLPPAPPTRPLPRVTGSAVEPRFHTGGAVPPRVCSTAGHAGHRSGRGLRRPRRHGPPAGGAGPGRMAAPAVAAEVARRPAGPRWQLPDDDPVGLRPQRAAGLPCYVARYRQYRRAFPAGTVRLRRPDHA